MTEFLQVYLPICIYILLIILLIIGIIIGVRLLNVMDKIESLVDNIQGKVNSLNSLFSIIDFTTNKINVISDRIVELFTNLFNKIINRKKESNEILEDDDYE